MVSLWIMQYGEAKAVLCPWFVAASPDDVHGAHGSILSRFAGEANCGFRTRYDHMVRYGNIDERLFCERSR